MACVLILFICYSLSAVSDEIDYIVARKKMVQEQLAARDITDKKVLDVMSCVERHKFVPERMKRYAYEDMPLPIGEGQTISQPYIVALMTQLLELKGKEKVLEIGTGSGYQAAILAELVKEVYTIEIIGSLGKTAEERLEELGYTNIKVKIADGYYGWEEYAPFDAIIVTAAAEYIPQPLIDQLKVGGRLVIPVGDTRMQSLLLVQKEPGGKLKEYEITGVLFVPLVGEHQKDKPEEKSTDSKKRWPSENKKWKRK
ncbi:MAG: hypothetical protein AMJ78_06305 [Omnitrophica WOR_2 bacterium SM23_29]|nr:MAG: hypothetical protein AMJ78_06305 [Omnitrophica WOR_2 bacterium SM23_29]